MDLDRTVEHIPPPYEERELPTLSSKGLDLALKQASFVAGILHKNLISVDGKEVAPKVDNKDFDQLFPKVNEPRKQITIRAKYLIYWKNLNFACKEDILVYDTTTDTEEVFNQETIFTKFPVPPPCSMWGTPFGHFSRYDVSLEPQLEQYQRIKEEKKRIKEERKEEG